MKELKEIETCYHCGDTYSGRSISFEGKEFCCDGCKMVYSLLKESNLCAYYDINEPSNLKRKPVAAKKFEFLDQDEIANQFLQFSSKEKAQVLFFIPDMHCSSCVWLLEKLHKLLPGILYSRVNFDRKELHITYNPQELGLRVLVEKLSVLGYEPSLNDTKSGVRDASTNRSLLFRLGIAGFCMGNIMLFSFPEYLGMEQQSIDDFGFLFKILSLVLALPVLFYSAQPFYSSAWKGLKAKNLNIDFPLALGIGTLFLRSLYEVFYIGGPGFFDSMSALVFFLLVGRWMQDKAYESLSFERDYASYFPIAVQCLTDETWSYKALNNIKVGDRIRIRNQELIPADSQLIEGDAHIDYSFVNGESRTEKIDTKGLVYAGGRQVGSLLELEVIKPVSQSYLTSLWNQFSKESENKNIHSFSDLIGKWFTILLLIIASLTLFYWLPIDADKAFKAFTAVLIVACPCVLVIAAPFALGNAMRWLGKRGIYLKNMNVVESASKIDTLAFDKTGTLSKPNQVAEYLLDTTSTEEKQMIRSLAACSSHPMSSLLFDSLKEFSFSDIDNFKEHSGQGVESWIENHHIQIGSAKWLDYPDKLVSGVFVRIDGIIKMGLSPKSEYRSGLNRVFKEELKPYSLHLYSGDTAREKEIVSAWFNESNMHFNCSPFEKETAIMDLRKKGNSVMMIGDGLNDAGALRRANLGIAITEDISSFTPASDIIMVGKSIYELPKFLSFCKQTMGVVKASFLFSLLYNSIWMLFAVRGDLYPLIAALLMPISSITVFTINTLGIRYFAKKGGLK